jgi:glutamate/tyrosine decarboxylase-like PLP-dependent enzyme
MTGDGRFQHTRALLRTALTSAEQYLHGLDGRPAGVSGEVIEALRQHLPEQWPADGLDDDVVLALLGRWVAPATVASAGGRYFGFVTGGALPVTLATNWLASVWDQNAFGSVSSPAAAVIEAQAAQWTLEALSLPSSSAVSFVTGATMANFCGLAAARHHLLERVDWDVERDGLYGAPNLRVVIGAEAHPAMTKALGFLGLGRARVEAVAVDDQGRMRADALPELDDMTIVCCQAGNVNSGAFDPLREIGERVASSGAWMHVDGAFGIWARACDRLRHLADGAELAHSMATDGHKWLNVPYDCGIAVVREPQALHGAMAIGAPYLPMEAAREPIHITPESSRRARGFEVWAALASLGRSGIADLVDRGCALAARMADVLGARNDLTILNDVTLNQVVVAMETDEQTNRLVKAVQADGTCWCGPTHWQGRAAMRISVSSWATTPEDIDVSAAAIARLAGQL